MTRLALIVCALCLAAGTAAADGFRPYDLERWLGGATAIRVEQPGRWNFNLGIGAAAVPEYLGGEDYAITALPLIDAEWRGRLFISSQRGIGYNWIRGDNAKIGTRLTFDLGRDSDVDPHLRGLPDVGVSVEPGLFGEFYLGAWRVKADVRHGFISGHEGFLASLDISLGGRITERTSLIVGGDVHVMDGNYADAYFGVPAATARLGAFAAGAGFRDVGGHASLIYDITDRIYVSLDGSASVLLGDASSSPVSREDYQVFVGVVVGYRY